MQIDFGGSKTVFAGGAHMLVRYGKTYVVGPIGFISAHVMSTPTPTTTLRVHPSSCLHNTSAPPASLTTTILSDVLNQDHRRDA